MAEVSVSQFAEVLKVPVDRLLAQLDQAGIKVSGPDARISDDAKLELLTHLRRSHGSDADSDGAPRKITLRRKTQSELKLASAQGRARTVNVEVRRKRTYIKRDVLEEQARVQQDELDPRRQRRRANARPPPPPPRRWRTTSSTRAMAVRSCTSPEMSARATRRSAAPRRAPFRRPPKGGMDSRCRPRRWCTRSASARRSRWRSWRRRWPSRPTRSSRR